jgi:tRNA threonylcarbamoyl adenosine modification protein YeaZ
MKFLALDTAMAACSVAVIDTGHRPALAQAFVPMERGHAEALAPLVEQAMAEADVSFKDLSGIAVTTGPGTFTGVRIGLAMARGLGLALNIPVFGIDTLSAIAANAGATGPVLVVAEARRGEVYAAVVGGDGKLRRPPAVVAAERAADGVEPGTAILGTAAETVIAASGRHDLARLTLGDLPVAAVFGRMAAALPTPSAMPAPLYLRTADAKPQANFHRREVPISCREADGTAAGVFAQMHGECFDNPWTATEFATLMAGAGALPCLAFEGPEPVGFLLARQAADEAEILTLGTRPFAQRRGVARALVGHAGGVLARRGVTVLFLEVAAANEAARGLYAACGFAEVGRRKGYYEHAQGRREDAVVMRKAIAP